MRKRILIALTVVAALAAAAYAYWNGAEVPEADRYLTAPVERGPVVVTVTATGIVNALATVQVGTYVSGPIIAIDVDFNSLVRTGQRVAKIDPAPFRVKVQRAEANLGNANANVQKARADLDLKRSTLKRFGDLREKDFISQNDYDTARSQYEQAQAGVAVAESTVRQAQADLQDAQINISYTDIKSPVDGVVVSRNVDVGQTVAASFQTPTLFQIAQDLSKMQVIASVSESDIAGAREGEKATFTVDAFPDRTFQGLVSQVRNAPITVQNVVTYNVMIDVDNSEMLLKPGMTANVAIVTAEQDSVLRVPLRALNFDPAKARSTPQERPSPNPTPVAQLGQEDVWRLREEATPERVVVTTGLRSENHIEITTGDLHEGDPVIIGLAREPASREAPSLIGQPRYRR